MSRIRMPEHSIWSPMADNHYQSILKLAFGQSSLLRSHLKSPSCACLR